MNKLFPGITALRIKKLCITLAKSIHGYFIFINSITIALLNPK